MGDRMPNYLLEQQRLRWQILAQETQIEQQRLAIMEMSDKKQRHLENIEASKKAIATYKEQLADLEKTHGKLTEENYKDMKDSLG